MKKYLLIVLLVIELYAEHVQWHSNYDKAHQEALKKDKLLMVLLIKDDCLLCSKILSETFRDREYIKTINDKFVSVIVKKDQKNSYPIEMLYTMSYPSIFFLDNKELFIGENIYGYVDFVTFEKHLTSELLLK